MEGDECESFSLNSDTCYSYAKKRVLKELSISA